MPDRKPRTKWASLETRVLKTIREYDMIGPGDRVLVALSGGADSTALLLCLDSLKSLLDCELAVAHLNHCLRGKEGDEDEAFARRMSAELGLEFVSEVIDVKARAVSTRQNLEQAARDARYDFLKRAAGRTGARKIAVGHNRNDQAETALFRFIRGSGVRGLSAIHPVVEGGIIRPLLDCTRERILKYLADRERGYREDSSNQDLRFSRNRIRRELVPYLEQNFNPQLVRTLAREARLMRETREFMDAEAARALGRICRSVDGGLLLEIAAIAALPPALQRQVLRHALGRCAGSLKGFTGAHVESLLALCRNAQSGDRAQLPHGYEAIRQFDDLLLGCATGSIPGYSYELQVPGVCRVVEAHAVFRADIRRDPESAQPADYSERAALDLSVLETPLVVRSRIAGDRYGGPRCRKVKKVLIDARIPLSRRDVLPMVVSGENVVWIPGLRPARIYQARDFSKSFVLIEFGPDPAEQDGDSDCAAGEGVL